LMFSRPYRSSLYSSVITGFFSSSHILCYNYYKYALENNYKDVVKYFICMCLFYHFVIFCHKFTDCLFNAFTFLFSPKRYENE
jgi:hypothetical protein